MSDRACSDSPQTIDQISPDGTPDAGNIFVMDPEGRSVKQVTEGAFADQRPTFSPDGSTIVFVSDRGGRIGLWHVPADGSGSPEPLRYSEFGYRPWFSIDGLDLFFFARLGDRHQVCRVGFDESTATPLTNDDRGMTHGPFTDPGGEVLLVHSTRAGDSGYAIYELPLDGSPMRPITVAGVKHAMHATRARNGMLTFDSIE